MVLPRRGVSLFSMQPSLETLVTPIGSEFAPHRNDLDRSQAPPPALLCPCMVAWAPSNYG